MDTVLPKYKCHKQVFALKIKDFQLNDPERLEAGAKITPENPDYATFGVDGNYVQRHYPAYPMIGGYYVVYEDGYKSYSPAEPFESGYAPIIATGNPTVYTAQPKVTAQIEKAFVYHAPKGDQATRYTSMRQTAKIFAEEIAMLTPASREQSVALTKLEEAVMWANAAIARNE